MILASILAKASDTITPEEADASAAIVVSVLIIMSLVPLFKGMVKSIRSLRRVNALVEAETRREALEGEVVGYNDGPGGNWA